jgi:lysozyme family protein
MDYIDTLITKVIDREGRAYENVANDRGGPTKFGITLGRLRTEWGRHCTADHVRNLTEEQARKIYRDAYFVRPRIDQLPEQIVEFVFDSYVTSGTWGIKFVQRVLADVGFDMPEDGVVSAEVVDAAEKAQAAMGRDFLRALIVERANFFGRIVANDGSQGKFLRGWINQRAAKFWESA